METGIEEIRNYFSTSWNSRNRLYSLKSCSPYQGWVVRFGPDSYGVAIPYDGDPVNEKFNGISFYSNQLETGHKDIRVLLLLSDLENAREQFALFSYSLVDPGPDGSFRKEIEKDPVNWWKNWKELVGNSSVDKKPYAVLGELATVCHLFSAGKNPVWGGPDGSTKDVEIPDAQYEVKSTLSRYDSKVKIHGQFQLQPSAEAEFLVFNRFERSPNGVSIDGLTAELIEKWKQNSGDLERKLTRLGLPEGSSARKEKYALLEQTVYPVNSKFPRITPESFKGNEIPEGIVKLEYTVDLDRCETLQEDSEYW